MRRRCYYVKDKHFKDYGGRGIAVCESWRQSYCDFREWAVKNGYKAGVQIDRIDNAGNYEPANCRWVTPTINARNTRKNRFIEAFGERKTLSEWAEDGRCRVNQYTLRKRLVRGWEPESAITKENCAFCSSLAA